MTDDDFCPTHGYEHMVSQFSNPVPYCAACEDDAAQHLKRSPEWLAGQQRIQDDEHADRERSASYIMSKGNRL